MPVPVLVPPVLEPDPMLPVPLEVPPAAPELLSFRQRSLSSPVSCAQRALPAPVAADPLLLLSVEVLPPMLLRGGRQREPGNVANQAAGR